VGGLDGPVHEAALVQPGERAGDREGDVPERLRRQRPRDEQRRAGRRPHGERLGLPSHDAGDALDTGCRGERLGLAVEPVALGGAGRALAEDLGSASLHQQHVHDPKNA
jgi:hypothetical protein